MIQNNDDYLSDKDDLERIKDNVSNSYMYFKDNYERFRNYRAYVFKENLSEKQKNLLRKKGWPVLECNVLEAYISRLLGEFAKHEPSIDVSPSEGVPVNEEVIDVVEQHFRHMLYQANKNSFSYEVYKDLLSGGFSVAKMHTDYASSMSFNQEIYLNRVFDPTLCGFDPLSRDSHKGDGNFCFEMYPMTEQDFKKEFPDVSTSNLSYSDSIEEFSWSYRDIKQNKLILVADYYEKKKKRTKIVKLADGRVMTVSQYNKMKKYWEEEQFIEQIPVVIGKPRTTILEKVCRYRLMENKILDYVETDYSYLPLVFIDGNSIILAKGKVNSTYQMTRPYVYHAKGMQDLKNFGMQSLANYVQSMIQSRLIVKKEAIPQEDDYREAIRKSQHANTIVVNAYNEQNPDQPIPEPIREVVNPSAPAELMGSLQIADPTIQMILGSFASNLGKNDNDLSGKAVIESASVGNAAAMPYVVGYLNGLTQLANIAVDLMPKYLLGKRTIPVVDKEGKKDYQEVNTEDTPNLDYNERALKVNIEAGVNFQVQKNQAVEQIIALMHASPQLGEFWNSEKGLKILARNLTVYGADNLEEAIDVFLQQQQQKQQQAMQMQQQAMQNDPMMIRAQAEMMKVQNEKEQQQVENELSAAQLSIDKILADAKLIEAESKVTDNQIASAVRLEEAETSRMNHSLDAAVKMSEIKEREHNQEIKSHKAVLDHHRFHKEMSKGDENENT